MWEWHVDHGFLPRTQPCNRNGDEGIACLLAGLSQSGFLLHGISAPAGHTSSSGFLFTTTTSPWLFPSFVVGCPTYLRPQRRKLPLQRPLDEGNLPQSPVP
jgi:hypothetical protein